MGEKKAKMLLTYFKSIERIKQADVADLEKVPGINKKLAIGIQRYFNEAAPNG